MSNHRSAGTTIARVRRVCRALLRAPSPARAAIGLRMLRDLWLDHVFDRSSPLPPLSDDVLERINAHEIVMPPRSLLMQPGNQTIEGLFFIVSLAKVLDAREIFEIGTYNGLTAWCLARNLPDSVVHTLDLPAQNQPRLQLEESDAANRIHFEQRIYESLDAPGRVRQHWGDSAEFDFEPFSERCDLVYVDGAHSEPYVASDTKHALNMLSEGGAVVWDDYWRQVSGVRHVLDGLDLELYRVRGTRLVVHLTPVALSRLKGGTSRP